MAKSFRMTRQAQRVLLLLLRSPREELSGVDVSQETGIASGSLYPLLYRLEAAGMVSARWEEQRPADLGRPRRRYYRLTGDGVKVAQSEVKQLEQLTGRLAWQ